MQQRTTAFLGRTKRGGLYVLTELASGREFSKKFGCQQRRLPLCDTIQRYFDSGAKRAVVIRVGHEPAATTLQDKNTDVLMWLPLGKDCAELAFHVQASSPGRWGRNLNVEITKRSLAETTHEFAFSVRSANEPSEFFTTRVLQLGRVSPGALIAQVAASSNLIKLVPVEPYGQDRLGWELLDTTWNHWEFHAGASGDNEPSIDTGVERKYAGGGTTTWQDYVHGATQLSQVEGISNVLTDCCLHLKGGHWGESAVQIYKEICERIGRQSPADQFVFMQLPDIEAAEHLVRAFKDDLQLASWNEDAIETEIEVNWLPKDVLCIRNVCSDQEDAVH